MTLHWGRLIIINILLEAAQSCIASLKLRAGMLGLGRVVKKEFPGRVLLTHLDA